jgi:hypothetical protein
MIDTLLSSHKLNAYKLASDFFPIVPPPEIGGTLNPRAYVYGAKFFARGHKTRINWPSGDARNIQMLKETHAFVNIFIPRTSFEQTYG